VFHLFGALAQFEREIIRDRTVAGLTAARARGRVGGRPSKLSGEQRRQARKMYDERELTVEQIGRVLGVSRTSIYRALADRPAAPTDGTSEAVPAPQVTDGPGERRAPRRRSPEPS
jgi:DNA invertase Pin-like site-specific DNA recombinase